MSFLDDFDPDDAKEREYEQRWEDERNTKYPEPKPPTPAKLPKFMRAFSWAWNAGYREGYERGKFEANQRRKK